MKIRIISNLTKLQSVQSSQFDIELYPCASGRHSYAEVFALFLRSFRYDYILLNGAPRLLFLFALLKWCVPFHNTKLVVLDILLSAPISARDKLKASLIRILMKKVHMILLYYKDTSGLQKCYSIPASKFRYVPFKINQYELIKNTKTTDGGYIFCGGKTRRDFNTLFEAIRGTDLPVRVVTTDNSDIAEHGSYLERSSAPPNVEIVILDGSAEKFIEHMAAARLVAMPIIPGICGAGIGVYIMAMALGKCVVISSIPGTGDILPQDAAIVVPAEDPTELRNALMRAFHDADYRRGFENAGREYAFALQGEDRLLLSVASVIQQDFAG